MSRHLPIVHAAAIAVVILVSGCRSVTSHESNAAKKNSSEAQTEAEDEALRNRARALAHYGTAVVHEFSDEDKNALEQFYLAAKASPEDQELLLDVSGRLIEGRDFAHALELLEPRALQDDASAVLAARLGYLYAQSGRFTNAIAANLVALRKQPNSFQASQNLYVNYLQTKQPDLALKVLDDAAALADLAPEFLMGIAELYSNFELQFPAQREALKARQLNVLHRAAKSSPLAPTLEMKLGDGLNLMGDADGARQVFLDLVKSSNVPPQLMALARTKLADALLRSNDRKGAAEQLKAIVQDDPSNATANFFLAQIELESQHWAVAAEYLKKVLILNPQLEQAYYDLARAQIGAGDDAGAIETLDVARGKYSSNFIIEFLNGTARAGMNKYDEAVRYFTRAEIVATATDDKRLSSGFFFQFGAALERSGNHEDAEKYFEKCLSLSPDDVEAMNYLGYMWAEQGVKLDRAKELISRALKAEPDNEAFLDSMGWVLFKLNQPEAALEHLLKAVEKSDKPDATIFDHLGDVRAALKQNDLAREAWTKSLNLETNDVVRKKIESIAAPPPSK